VKDKTQKKVI